MNSLLSFRTLGLMLGGFGVFASSVSGQTAGGPAPARLGISASGNQILLRWNALSGGRQLLTTDNLSDSKSWKPITQAELDAEGFWNRSLTPGTTKPRAFFGLGEATPPSTPPNARLEQVDDHLLLTWDAQPDASNFTVYVGTEPNFTIPQAVKSIDISIITCITIAELEPDKTYYFRLVSKNSRGSSVPTAPVATIFGPKSSVSGKAVKSFDLPNGSFEVEVPAADLRLALPNNPANLPFQTVTDDQGRFAIRQAPRGPVQLLWNQAGQSIPIGKEFDLQAPLSLSPLKLPTGPAAAGFVVIGSLKLCSGTAAQAVLPEFGLSHKATIQATMADGRVEQITPDRKGHWCLTNLRPGSYPIQLLGKFANIETSYVLDKPQLELAPIAMQFSEKCPRANRIRISQKESEVVNVDPKLPFTLTAETENPDQVALQPYWVAELNGQKQIARGETATFDFSQQVGGVDNTGLVRVRYFPSLLSVLDPSIISVPIIKFATLNCWSGQTGVWQASLPNDIQPLEGTTITINHSTGVTSTTAAPGLSGYFETGLNPTSKAPYVFRAEKAGHMRFLWRFEFGLPLEAEFSLVPADLMTATVGVTTVTLTHTSGAKLTLPPTSLTTPTNVVYTGPIEVRLAFFDPLTKSPMPPDVQLDLITDRQGINSFTAVWFEITTPGGVKLTPSNAATLTLPTNFPSFLQPLTWPAYHQNETTALFNNWGSATKTVLNRYQVPLGDSGLFILGQASPLNELVFEADRTLNYPFDVLIGTSIFPVTVQSFCRNSLYHVYVPKDVGRTITALDVRHGPGQSYSVVATSPLPTEPMKKPPVWRQAVTPSVAPLVYPAVAAQWVRLSLGQTEVDLKANPGDTTVTTIAASDFFLKYVSNDAAAAADYYNRIAAPADLNTWRSQVGLPTTFGAALPGVPATEYSTAYYYNLGDLGFARAQTMRLRLAADSQWDVAFAVTNYESLEEARCGRNPIATVCMDYRLKRDKNKLISTRYTRFYVYGGNGLLQQCADLDGSGEAKYVPNLCVMCHGGTPFATGGPTNLGSRFLAFDLESYSFHPKFGKQLSQLAAMNAGVLKTNVNTALTDAITGWYGNADPNLAPLTFNQTYVPSTWSGNPTLYSNTFKGGCRVCHISRTNYLFDSLTAFQSYGYGSYPACTGLYMPQAQRTWGAFWGSRCSNILGVVVPDMPSTLGTAAGTVCR